METPYLIITFIVGLACFAVGIAFTLATFGDGARRLYEQLGYDNGYGYDEGFKAGKEMLDKLVSDAKNAGNHEGYFECRMLTAERIDAAYRDGLATMQAECAAAVNAYAARLDEAQDRANNAFSLLIDDIKALEPESEDDDTAESEDDEPEPSLFGRPLTREEVGSLPPKARVMSICEADGAAGGLGIETAQEFDYHGFDSYDTYLISLPAPEEV